MRIEAHDFQTVFDVCHSPTMHTCTNVQLDNSHRARYGATEIELRENDGQRRNTNAAVWQTSHVVYVAFCQLLKAILKCIQIVA